MFHLSAFSGLIGTVANTSIAALTDDIIPKGSTGFLPYRDYLMRAAYAASATLSRARLNSGTIRQVNPTYIRPINVGTLPANNPNMMLLLDNPFLVKAHEELTMEVTSAIAMGTEQFTGLIWLATSIDQPPVGRVYNLRWTSTTAAVANTWTTIAYTLETGIPAGRWAVIDSECQSTNAIAHRIIFDQQVERPGCLSKTSLANRNPYITDYGRMGMWGYFFTYSLPRIQVLVNGTDNAHEGYLRIVQMPGGMVA